jgi:hypothetical protein
MRDAVLRAACISCLETMPWDQTRTEPWSIIRSKRAAWLNTYI